MYFFVFMYDTFQMLGYNRDVVICYYLKDNVGFCKFVALNKKLTG